MSTGMMVLVKKIINGFVRNGTVLSEPVGELSAMDLAAEQLAYTIDGDTYESGTTMTIDDGEVLDGWVMAKEPSMESDRTLDGDKKPIYFQANNPFVFTASAAPVTSTISVNVPLGEPEYTFHIPANTTLQLNKTEKQALDGKVYISDVKNMEIKTATCTVAGENLKKGSDTLETAYFYGEDGATAVATTPTFNCGEGEENGTPIYAQVADWSAAKPGTYTATVTFVFDVKPVVIKDVFTCVSELDEYSLPVNGWISDEMYEGGTYAEIGGHTLNAALIDVSGYNMGIDEVFLVMVCLKGTAMMMTDPNMPVIPVDNGWMAVDEDFTYNFVTDDTGTVVALRVSIDQATLDKSDLNGGDNIDAYATIIAYPPAEE